MWIDCDDECVLINTELHRQKFKNVEATRVTVCVWERTTLPLPRGPRRRRRHRSRRGAEHIDQLAMRYFDRLYRDDDIESERVILRIRPIGGGHGRADASDALRRRALVPAVDVVVAAWHAAPTGAARGRPPRRRAGLPLAVAVRAPLLLRRLLPGAADGGRGRPGGHERLRLGTGMLLAPYQRPERIVAGSRASSAGASMAGSTSGSAWATAMSSSTARAFPVRERVARLRALVGELDGANAGALRRCGWAPSRRRASPGPDDSATASCCPGHSPCRGARPHDAPPDGVDRGRPAWRAPAPRRRAAQPVDHHRPGRARRRARLAAGQLRALPGPRLGGRRVRRRARRSTSPATPSGRSRPRWRRRSSARSTRSSTGCARSPTPASTTSCCASPSKGRRRRRSTTVMRDFADGVFPVLADDGEHGAVRIGVTLPHGRRGRARRGRRGGRLAVRATSPPRPGPRSIAAAPWWRRRAPYASLVGVGARRREPGDARRGDRRRSTT